MKHTKHLLTGAVLLASMLNMGSIKADQIPGYIGSMSFRLTDDRDYANLLQAAENAKVEYVRADQARAQLRDQFNSLSKQANDLRAEMDRLSAQIQQEQTDLKAQQDKLATLKQNPEQNKAEIDTTQGSIDRLTTLIQRDQQALGQTKLQVGNVLPQVDRLSRDLQVANDRANNLRNRMLQIGQERENYERQIIADIQRINRDGANRGSSDGNADGVDLAVRIGMDQGNKDGSQDGFGRGTSDGQSRDYSRGNAQGEAEGSSRASTDGQRDGTNLGTIDGNKSAADREGDAAGVVRADKSDAAKVGTDQGKKAGLNHAQIDGRIAGEDKAEKESIQKFESGALSDVKLNGPFAGSFERRTPGYPGDFNGSHYRPDVSAGKEIYRRAFADGYIYTYRDQSRRAYINGIDSAYNRQYDSSFNQNYQTAYNRDYPDYFSAGRRDGDAKAYNRDYPVVRDNYYRDYFAKFNQNPNRSAGEYKSTYAVSEPRAYARHYEEIRSVNFDRVEKETYAANIAEQTELNRVRRNSEVAKIFNENAILSYVSSEMLDGGITGIAKLDGVFQPGETTLHNIVISNFGFKEAKNVRVVVDGGKEIALPSIPARSKVTVFGAGSSKLSESLKIGSVGKTSLAVLSSLTSDDAIEAIHFDSIGKGVLKSSDVKSTTVQFPFALASLKLDSDLLKDVKNKLSVAVSNNSKRPYNGELKIELVANSQNQLIQKDFSTISAIGAGAAQTLNDAEVLVSSDDDAYRDLAISAKISQNGVTLGVLSSDLVTMARATFSDKGALPVIVVDSKKNLDDFLDVLGNLGGTKNVSILDTSLSNLNAQVLANGLAQKTLVIVDDENLSTAKKLDGFIAKSKGAGILLVSDIANPIDTIATNESMKDAFKLNLDKRLIIFGNPQRANINGVQAITATKKEGVMSALPIAQTLSLSADNLLAKLKTDINGKTFFTPNDSLKIYSLRTMAEVLNINLAYDKSGNIFTRDKKWAEMISDDSSLFLNKIKAASNGSVSSDKLGAVLSAIAVKDFVGTAMSDYWDISKKMMPKILNATNKVLGNMEDGFKKSLKDFDRDLYNNSYAKASIQRPFYIEPKQDQNN